MRSRCPSVLYSKKKLRIARAASHTHTNFLPSTNQIIILLRSSRDPNEAPIESEALGLRPVGPCLKMSLHIPWYSSVAELKEAIELWFQQDGATCYTARATIDLLKDTFGDRLISRFGPVNWPPRSCDLTPLDYFLWGYVKSLVYADKPQTLDHLEDNIRRVIADIRPQMLEKVIENWTSRLDYIRASRGSPMPEIIFKM
ncbi:transposable element Tc3 transposase [Trichonephila clavipes]|nr:transposable element Tc3 transposase [Trichonephila clavipes]